MIDARGRPGRGVSKAIDAQHESPPRAETSLCASRARAAGGARAGVRGPAARPLALRDRSRARLPRHAPEIPALQ
ncbi:hypothetical protein BOC60_19190 [Burkholderia pseudomallei]|nr:hypothetical protein BK015_22475 [Burkholderia pseudomallei]ARK42432.1 hypothetical protein BOC60_19190 [Burkholderia pseudomallei]